MGRQVNLTSLSKNDGAGNGNQDSPRDKDHNIHNRSDCSVRIPVMGIHQMEIEGEIK